MGQTTVSGPHTSAAGYTTTGAITTTGTLTGGTATITGNASVGGAEVTLSGIPTYADDAAAGTGGMTSGQVYQTATGELRIKT